LPMTRPLQRLPSKQPFMRSNSVPLLRLLSVRTKTTASTDHLRDHYDVVVVGGGVIGASVAYHTALTDPSLRVCVVESEPRFTHASAVLSAGGIRQQFSVPANIQLCQYGAEFLRRASTDLHVNDGSDAPDVQLKEQGYLFLASEEGAATLRQNHATQQAQGAHTTLLDPSQLASRFPWLCLDDVVLGCLGESGEGWFDPWALLAGMRAKARHMGVHFLHGTVIWLDVVRRQNHRSSGEAVSEISAVQVSRPSRSQDDPCTSHTRIGADVVVNASGAFANRIVAMCGPEEEVAPLPVEARKRCIFSLHCSPDSSQLAVAPPPSSPFVVDVSGVYWRPEGAEGHFITGVSPPPDWQAGDPDYACFSSQSISEQLQLRQIDHALFDELIWPALFGRCEAFGSLKVRTAWAGFYDFNSVDQNGVIGPHPHVPNLILANGFSGHGLMQAPGAGRAVAELITSGAFQTINLDCFSFQRLMEGGEPLYEQNVI